MAVRRLLTTLSLTGALALSGCAGADGTDFEGAEQAVADAVLDLQSAARSGDGAEEICTQALTRELRERLDAGGSSCRQEIAFAVADADLFALMVTDVEVSGDRARAVTESAGGDTEAAATFLLERVEGSWRIAGLEPRANG